MSRYVTELPYTLELPGKWEVALTEMYMPHSWFNIDASNNSIEFFEGNRTEGMAPTTPAAVGVETNNSSEYNKTEDKDTTGVFSHVNATSTHFSQAKLPEGYYNSVKDIIDAIHKSLSELARQNIHIRKNFNGTLTVKTEKDASLWLNGNLTLMLGFTQSYIKGQVTSKYVADVKNGMYSAVVYTDIILPQIIGDIQAQVLRVLPLHGPPDKLLVYRFPALDYITLARNSIPSISIDIRNDHREPIVFQQGKVLCKLHFRPCIG
jgi:hypothetical protein